ncbi:hypothetical protein llap_11670 [Limosa lapponica baueri]|uniref:Uncharacterized protein n=1 Tax=Limosa lapponica baueri TaxID=1758121 RepID=A0A2I0TW61_LIMLA|nr:hypothetical protein llap_11670 [Limosa lapponica baueri]
MVRKTIGSDDETVTSHLFDQIRRHMSKEFVYHILGRISSAAAGPVAAGMMMIQKEPTLAATGVTSRYEGVLPYPKTGLRAMHPPAAQGRGLGREGEGQPQQRLVQAEGGAFCGERAEKRQCKEPSFVMEAVLIPISAASPCF